MLEKRLVPRLFLLLLGAVLIAMAGAYPTLGRAVPAMRPALAAKSFARRKVLPDLKAVGAEEAVPYKLRNLYQISDFELIDKGVDGCTTHSFSLD
ncbi:MAG: hypothetical protein D6742_08315 [Cyanobacteria bacterium J069]|nr:MAG: hypothetical protein D6742_08315 [Cyanobacteria bacterium J069]